MNKQTRTPADWKVRAHLVTAFDRNVLVEAGAGSGKTHSLAMRMAAGIAEGHYTVEHMAAVTFTRKAAAELRGRFQLALETRLAADPSAAERQRLDLALARIERLFAGTIHAFCAHVLRERPVDARVAPGFVELDDVENQRIRTRAWRDYVSAARARGFRPMLDLFDAGLKPKDLDHAFTSVCEHEDVAFDMGSGEPPDFGAEFERTAGFWQALARFKPASFAEGSKCQAQQRYVEFESRLASVRRTRSLAQLAALLTFWNKTTLTMKWWGEAVGADPGGARRARDLVEAFQADVIDPFLMRWRAYVHRLAMAVLVEARDAFSRERRRRNVVNYVDLLRVAGTMLRTCPDVRLALQRKYRWLFVDEFQDTDPIQAEIFLMLAGDEPVMRGGRPGPGTTVDPFALPLRPGALFVVGDPKQSIFRFRRADIDIYNRVGSRLVETGGAVVSLTANFRSVPAVCDLANTVFPPLFAAAPFPYSPRFTPLDPVRVDEIGKPPAAPVVSRRRSHASQGAFDFQNIAPEQQGIPQEPGTGVACLTVPVAGDADATVAAEAALIAAYVRAEVSAGRRSYGDFLVLTRFRKRLGAYADAFDDLEIPAEVSGAGLFCKSPEVRALALLLGALADPLDAVSLVGVLRGPIFGLSDPALFQYRQAGGRFELNMPLPVAADEQAAAALDTAYGPVLEAMRQLREMLHQTRRLPLAAALAHILEHSGWLALAATTPGGARAGHLLQAVDEVRQVAESGGGLADAADALNEEDESTESEAWPLEPGRRDVVRLMNLHKAKGLEAPVVFLADPLHDYTFPTTVRVVRSGADATGHLRIVRKKDKGYGETTLAQPADWDAHESEEKKYLAAERLRLLYVAATRAEDLLIVVRTGDASKDKAWKDLMGYVEGQAGIGRPAATPVVRASAADVSPAVRAAAGARRVARLEVLRRPSWAVTSPAAEKSRLTSAERARRVASEPGAAAAVPDTLSHRADAGVAWGTFIHGLLEHAMRHPAATRADLERLARWLTVEEEDLRPFIDEALAWVDDVRRLPFWEDAAASGERHVEVPFAVRADRGAAPGEPPPETMPTVLRGIIDLVHRSGDGWRVLDYKSDQTDGLTDVEAELRRRYAAQLAQYTLAWERGTGDRVVAVELVALRAKRTIGI